MEYSNRSFSIPEHPPPPEFYLPEGTPFEDRMAMEKFVYNIKLIDLSGEIVLSKHRLLSMMLDVGYYRGTNNWEEMQGELQECTNAITQSQAYFSHNDCLLEDPYLECFRDLNPGLIMIYRYQVSNHQTSIIEHESLLRKVREMRRENSSRNGNSNHQENQNQLYNLGPVESPHKNQQPNQNQNAFRNHTPLQTPVTTDPFGDERNVVNHFPQQSQNPNQLQSSTNQAVNHTEHQFMHGNHNQLNSNQGPQTNPNELSNILRQARLENPKEFKKMVQNELRSRNLYPNSNQSHSNQGPISNHNINQNHNQFF